MPLAGMSLFVSQYLVQLLLGVVIRIDKYPVEERERPVCLLEQAYIGTVYPRLPATEGEADDTDELYEQADCQ